MRVFNKDKTVEITEYDLTLGRIVPDKLFVSHHEAGEPTDEVWHYETVRKYPGGGKDVKKVIDIPAVKGHDAYDEYENILVYIPYTEAELAAIEISELKRKLGATDYQAIKYAEGVISDEEYADMKAQRQAWRDRINELERAVGGSV